MTAPRGAHPTPTEATGRRTSTVGAGEPSRAEGAETPEATPLQGIRKAAALLKTMPAEQARQVLAQFEPGDRQAIADAMASLELSREACRRLLSQDPVEAGQPDGPPVRPFACLESVSAIELAWFLQMQHPQVAAAVVPHLGADQAQDMLHAMLPPFRAEVRERVRRSRTPEAPVLARLARLLREALTLSAPAEPWGRS